MLENRLNLFYTTANTIDIYDDFVADLGLEIDENTELNFVIDGFCLENYTASADGYSGDELTRGTGLWGYTFGCYTSAERNGAVSSIDGIVPYAVSDGHRTRVAMYMQTQEEYGNTACKGKFLYYDVNDDAIREYTFINPNNPTPIYDVTLDDQKYLYSYNYTDTSPDLENASNLYCIDSFTNWLGGVPSFSTIELYYLVTKFSTNIPLFDTYAHAEAYLKDLTDQTTEGLLNAGSGPAPDPEEEYKEQFKYWYVRNKWGWNNRNTANPGNTVKNYRFSPKRKGISFVKHNPTASEPYDRILVHYSGYDATYAPWGATDDDDFIPNPNVTTHFVSKSFSFGANDYYTRFAFETNIPLWNSQQDADDYYNGLKDISEADNYEYISREDDSILNPDLPGTDVDEETDTGTNGMRFSYGSRLYAITNIELASLMNELFDPANLQDILDGTKLFGSNNMQAISGVMYLPLTDLSSICTLGSLANIKIGSWESQQAQGKRISDNEGTIDCGSFFYNRIYQDFRDYEPYNLLFANLPFVGMHQLTISKYLDKTVSVAYNIDVTTGAIVCKLFADGILVDVFDGTCGASRPISATDNNAYINNIVGAITGASANASGSIEGITNSVSQIGGAMGAGGTAGAAMLASGGTLMAMGAAGGAAASGIYQGYQIKNAVDNPPQMHRGNLAGNLAYNLNTKPTFLFFTKRTIRPENELDVIGYPSGHGGQISLFSGFLSASAVKLSSFNGTETEQNELLSILQGGIYL